MHAIKPHLILPSTIDQHALAGVRGGMTRPELANILAPATEERDRCLAGARGNSWETQSCNTKFLETVAGKLAPSLGTAPVPQTSQQVCTRNVGSGCFAAGTLVRTPRGLVPIERLLGGDEVLAREGIARVAIAHHAVARELVRIDFVDGPSVTSTPWHRFIDIFGNLVTADQVRADMQLRTRDSISRVTRVDALPQATHEVFNLTLERGATFYANNKLVEAGRANELRSRHLRASLA